MPIRQRYLSQEDTRLVQKFSLPPKLLPLFDWILPMGTIISRHRLFRDELPKYDENKITIDEVDYSVRPAWSAYHGSPTTHVMIIGHIMICHVIKDALFYYQPSVRLFGEDAKTRTQSFEALVQRSQPFKGWQHSVAQKKTTA